MSRYLIIMGAQGAGKGTQAAYINQTYNIPHVSTGDLFRAMRTRTDALAQRVQDIMRQGGLIDDATTNDVLKDRLEQPDAVNGVILDGYPRNPAQAQWLENYLQERGQRLAGVILLNLDAYTAFKRAYGRVSSEKTKETYNIFFNNQDIEWQFIEHPDKEFPPRVHAVLKSTGEELRRRPDDEAGSVIKRIDTYLNETAPLVEYYRSKGLLIEIDADQPIAAVSQSIKTVVDSLT